MNITITIKLQSNLVSRHYFHEWELTSVILEQALQGCYKWDYISVEKDNNPYFVIATASTQEKEITTVVFYRTLLRTTKTLKRIKDFFRNRNFECADTDVYKRVIDIAPF